MDNKKVILIMKSLFTLLFVLWMIVVFVLSSQNAEESSNLSGNFIEKILEIKDDFFSKSDNEEKSKNNKLVIEVDNIDYIDENKEEIVTNENKTEKILPKRIEKWQKITRKMAHYTIYAVGGIIIYCMVITYAESRKIKLKNIVIAISIGILNAILDEIHQFFSDGRTPQLFDVIVDTLGIVTGIVVGIIIILVLNGIINYIYERRNEVND